MPFLNNTGVTRLVTDLKSRFAALTHNHAASDITSGTLPIARGGTAGTTKEEARTSLEVPVNSAIATVESATATANHAIGDHFMLGDKLKTATAAIATGETISATNSANATVQAQIDALRDSVSHLHLNGLDIDFIHTEAGNNLIDFVVGNTHYRLQFGDFGIKYAIGSGSSWRDVWNK